jgi:hypothetical protein
MAKISRQHNKKQMQMTDVHMGLAVHKYAGCKLILPDPREYGKFGGQCWIVDS